MSNAAKKSQQLFLKRSRDTEINVPINALKDVVDSQDPVLTHIDVLSSYQDEFPTLTQWVVDYQPESQMLTIFTDQVRSDQSETSNKKLIHDANNLLCRLMMQVELLQATASSPEIKELSNDVGNTIDELVQVLKFRQI